MATAKRRARSGPAKRKRAPKQSEKEGLIRVREGLAWIWKNRGRPDPTRGFKPGERPPQEPTGEPSLSKREFMAFWHIARSYFYRLIDNGLPVRSDGRINFFEGGEWFTGNVGRIMRPAELGPAQAIEDPDVHDPGAIDFVYMLDTHAQFAERLNTT